MDGNRLDQSDRIVPKTGFFEKKQQKIAFFQKKSSKKFGSLKKLRTFAIPNEKYGSSAEIAQLVEHNLAKVGVASSSLVFRSRTGHLRMTFIMASAEVAEP